MSADLLVSPRSRAEHLGLPLPDDLHAVSACLPTWAHNVGYEEGDAAVIDRLQAAYPRFCFHPIVQKLCDEVLNHDDSRGLPFASLAAANRAIDFVKHAVQAVGRLIPIDGQTICGVTVSSEHFPVLKQYWQHAGENASSRVAELVLRKESAHCSETTDRSIVRSRVAKLQSTDAEDVFLFPSGMAAIAATWRSVQQGWPGETCQFGFPYVDTLKIQQRFPRATHQFLPLGNAADLQTLRERCHTSAPAAVFCEVPTNPLLATPDLAELRAMADQFGFVLVVDDTLAACGNLSVLNYADVVVTSLTKYFSGYGNVLAGAVTLNRNGSHYDALSKLIAADFEEMLSDVDVAVLRANSEDLNQRMEAINSNAAQLAEFLRGHPAVESVFYPTSADSNYEALRNRNDGNDRNGGYGGLLSIVLKDAASTTPAVFDALDVCKGPNLGTYFTLCCPYTILAHYTELDFAESCGVSRWLLRVGVGVEPIEELCRRFETALAAAESVS